MELKLIGLNALLNLGAAVDYDSGYVEGQRRAIELFGCLPVIINRQTMHLLSDRNHLKILKTMHDSGTPAPRHAEHWLIPVIIGDWPTTDEKHVSLWLNGGIKGNLLAQPYLDSIQGVLLDYGPENWQNASAIGLDVDDLLYLLDTFNDDEPPPPQDEPPVDDSWGIPQLDIGLQGVDIDSFNKWGTLARTAITEGETYHFYTDDSKFMSLIDNPQPVIDSRCESVVEPNFSIGQDTPRAVALYYIYQKRRLARFWQQKAGIRVFVDMNVPSAYFDLNLLGIPAGWTAYANRAYARDLEHLASAYRAARAHAGEPIRYVVYGGGGSAKALCAAHGWHWIPDHTHVVHEESGNGQRAQN